MPPVGFEPTTSTGERPQTYALDRAAIGAGKNVLLSGKRNTNLRLDMKTNSKWRLQRTVKVTAILRREEAENCALLGYYAASSDYFFYGFCFGLLNPEDGADMLSRNVRKKLPLLAA